MNRQLAEKTFQMDQMWKTTTSEPITESVMRSGSISLSIVPSREGRQWQFCQLAFGRYAESADHDKCKARWPRQALTLARAELDRLEAQLDETWMEG